jgi:hypothetical protein
VLFLFLLNANSKESKEWWINQQVSTKAEDGMNERDLESGVMGQ